MLKVLLFLGILALAKCAVLNNERFVNTRIVGGRQVSIEKHPHQVTLRRRACVGCTYSHTCGGSIYNEDIIITAAHCVIGRNPNDFLVVAATERRNGADGVVSRVENIILHEEYSSTSTGNDVALMFLSSKLPINNVTISPIALAAIHPENGVKSLVTGWGTTTQGGIPSDELLEVEVPIVSNELCNKAYGEGRITDSMLCAGAVGGGKDACQGDSGGPLIVHGELAGIVSWGRGCAQPDYPGVYASVAFLKKWIENTAVKKNRFLEI